MRFTCSRHYCTLIAIERLIPTLLAIVKAGQLLCLNPLVQVAPKSCGHVRGKRVVGRQEALARLRAAVDAREEGADILIVARTDARQAISLQVQRM